MMELPICPKCIPMAATNLQIFKMVPLSDYGQDGASVIFKAWACVNPRCKYTLRVDKGVVTYGPKVET